MSRVSKLRTLTKKEIPARVTTGILSRAIGAALGLALATASAEAQDNPIGPEGQVTVSAPLGYTVTPGGFAPVVIVSQSRLVHYEDLDLRTEDGADTLRSRIYAAARMMCKRLDMSYPATATGWSIEDRGDPSCYRGAIDRAMPGAYAAIDAARVGYGGH